MIDLKVYLTSMIQGKIQGCPDEGNWIIVLKGLNTELINENYIIALDDLLENKLNYFLKITQSGRKIISYDEYLALYDLVLLQYEKIIVFENNMFINYFPLYAALSNEKLEALANHYDEEKEGDKYVIGNIINLTSIYGNIKSINGRYYVTYNNIISNEKEEIFKVFEKSIDAIEKEKISLSSCCYDILDEEDYICMLDDFLYKDIKISYILEKNSSISEILLKEKISVLKFILQDSVSIKIGIIDKELPEPPIRQEFMDILKDYWGFNSFRKIKIYNTNQLINAEKIVNEISQGQIITNIVNEIEKCINKKDYRDIFITAPTGAGKSVIFQIPAIYIAEKYKLFTIVISPLIGLMKDQVENLQLHNYNSARTINSDISPIQKQEIINEIADNKCDILYISPESLLSKSDLEQIIGNRTLGLLVVDEAHIVTTWGKQFRPDYWYLGDHLSRIKKAQLKKRNMSFVLVTLTATAIYGGIENMYEETIQSLRMVDPITYLGYIKREDISINIEKAGLIKEKNEYELNKFDKLIEKIDNAMMFSKKMLIYFPTVMLINRFWEYCVFKNMDQYVAKYHGQLTSYEKEESYKRFLNGEAPIMLATKAFGMGIDIDDIEVIAHFAPTGNVCDYVQEIGRAARKSNLKGEAYYSFMRNDFKHINQLYGLSVIREYQLIEVIRKVYELHQENLRNNSGKFITKKRNEMLVDAESFAHIFENPFLNEEDGINKVKTAMLLIQKDFERRFSFSPFNVRPIPLFETGFFMIDPRHQGNLKKRYGTVLQEIDSSMHICAVNLKKIWEFKFNSRYSFPRFKYMLYTRDSELDFEYKEQMKPALYVSIDFQKNYLIKYEAYMNAIKAIINKSIREEKYYGIDGDNGLVKQLMELTSINIYKAKSIIETIISSMSVYQRDYSKNIHGRVLTGKPLKSGEVKYRFMNGANGFFKWIQNGLLYISDNIIENTLYLMEEPGSKGFKEKLLILGILETLDILVFKALGGRNSQIYIYVNQTKTMKEIIEKPKRYKNRLLEIISERHEISVAMLTYIFEGEFSNQDIWGLIENYFLGIIPDQVIKNYELKASEKLKLISK